MGGERGLVGEMGEMGSAGERGKVGGQSGRAKWAGKMGGARQAKGRSLYSIELSHGKLASGSDSSIFVKKYDV